jgi:hypothetical protein
MGKAVEYRRYATECLELASVFKSPEARAVLLHMAQSWLRLADKWAAHLHNAVEDETAHLKH